VHSGSQFLRRGLEHRSDAHVRSAGRDERHLDAGASAVI